MVERTTRESHASSEAMEQAAEFVRRSEQGEPERPFATLVLCALVAACAFAVPMWVSSLFDPPAPATQSLSPEVAGPPAARVSLHRTGAVDAGTSPLGPVVEQSINACVDPGL